MAFLGPALRWPDAVGVRMHSAVASVQPHLPPPLSTISPDILFSISASFVFVFLLTIALPILRGPPGSAVSVSSGSTYAKARDVPNILLAGPSSTGKTSLFSALALQSVPSVHPSQHASQTIVGITAEGANDLKVPRKRNIHLIDTPGHPRIKDRIIEEHLQDVDLIAFCVDAKEALKGSVSAGRAASPRQSSGHLHSLLTQLSKMRSSAKSRPPTLLLLFTRADLSPHLANVQLSATNEDEIKRRRVLLNRAQGALEAELSRRRAGLGMMGNKTTKIGGMSKVTGGEGNSSIVDRIKSLLGLRTSYATTNEKEEAEAEEESGDYLQPDMVDRSAIGILSRLHRNVIFGGKAESAFAALGKERGWSDREDFDGLQELKGILAGI